MQKAYVLHSRPYRETSAIIEFFSENDGRISAVAKGVNSKKSQLKGVLQPFQLLLVEYSGKSELKTLTYAEIDEFSASLNGKALYAGFYVNEISMRLLPKELNEPALFDCYQQCLKHLITQPLLLEIALRQFELSLLEELGYGLDFSEILALSENDLAKKVYTFVPQQGFIEQQTVDKQNEFLAEDLVAVAQRNFSQQQYLSAAKRLMRLALSPYLGDKPLTSRALFKSSY